MGRIILEISDVESGAINCHQILTFILGQKKLNLKISHDILSREAKQSKNVKIQIFDKSEEKQEFLSLNFPSPVILRVWEDTRGCVGGSAGPVCKMAAQM